MGDLKVTHSFIVFSYNEDNNIIKNKKTDRIIKPNVLVGLEVKRTFNIFICYVLSLLNL